MGHPFPVVPCSAAGARIPSLARASAASSRLFPDAPSAFRSVRDRGRPIIPVFMPRLSLIQDDAAEYAAKGRRVTHAGLLIHHEARDQGIDAGGHFVMNRPQPGSQVLGWDRSGPLLP